ncbi:MAG: transglutaminase domain-containing protein, partial [Bacteroidota bacterium]
MKWLLPISFLFLFHPAFSQDESAALATKLTAFAKTDLEKVTAIFKWITGNIAYRVKPNGKTEVVAVNALKTINSGADTEDGPLKPLNQRVAETVLEKRVAVCDGYARLFTTLCDHVGIRSEIIIGYARTVSNKPASRFGVNHYWNAVMIDSSWYLLDATWASGYISAGGHQFIRDYDGTYFLTPARIFFQDHYPDNARWTLLPGSPVPDEFRRSPFKQKSFTKYQITSFSPAGGVIETFVGDTI